MATLRIYPTGDYSTGSWSSAPLWSKVDDGSSPIVASSTSVTTCYFTWTNHTTEAGPISQISIYVNCSIPNPVNNPLNVVGPTRALASGANSIIFTTNPATGLAWTWADIDALLTGFSGSYYTATPKGGSLTYYYCIVYQTYIDVVYTAVVAPTVTTSDANSVTLSGCTGNGNITATGGENCTRRGFCYMIGTSGDPTTANSIAYDDGSFTTGAYTKAITGLYSSMSYRVRAYATNSAGTSYGTTVQVNTLRRNTMYLIF